jgi:hypothetical protein
VIGLAELRKYLSNKEDKYIKISKYRGSLETCHWRCMNQDSGMLDLWAVRFGGVKDKIPFLVFDAIKTELELGGDTYCIGGKWPSHIMDGYELKDKGYFGAFKAIDDIPEETRAVMDAFGPVLGKLGHRGAWSMEIRRVDEDHFFFIDATPRFPLPASGSEMEIYSNLPVIIAGGADGELVNPDPSALFAVECVLTQKGEKESWGCVEVPGELAQWMKLGGSCLVDGVMWFPPTKDGGHEIGWLVAIGDTPKAAVETMLEHSKALPDGVSAETKDLADLLKEIHKAEAEGVEFSREIVPEPETVIKEE